MKNSTESSNDFDSSQRLTTFLSKAMIHGVQVLNEFGRRLMKHIISDGSVRAPLVEELLDLCSMEIKYLNPIVEEKITIGKLGFVPVQ